jgi:hypothetical protein
VENRHHDGAVTMDCPQHGTVTVRLASQCALVGAGYPEDASCPAS